MNNNYGANNYGNYGYNPYANNGYYPYANNTNANQYQPQNGQNLNQNLSNYNNYNSQNQNQIFQQRVKCDYIPIGSIEEVKAHIMIPNTTVLFKDVNNKIIYEKKTDMQGVSEIKAYQETSISSNNEYVRQQDFIAFKNDLESRLNNLTSQTQNNSVGQNLSQNNEVK